MVYFQINMSGFLMLWHSYNPWKTFHEPLNILHHLRSTRKKAVSIHQGQKCFRRGFDKIKRPPHPCPRQWEKILRCENKTQLVEFFVDEWSKMRPGFTLEGKLISPSPPPQKLMSLDHCQQCCCCERGWFWALSGIAWKCFYAENTQWIMDASQLWFDPQIQTLIEVLACILLSLERLVNPGLLI